MENTVRQKQMCFYFDKIIKRTISRSLLRRGREDAFKRNSLYCCSRFHYSNTYYIVHNSRSWIDISKMSRLVHNVSFSQAFSHAQLDSQSIQYFSVICALQLLRMKKGAWRSDKPPQYLDLPCFCMEHLYLNLNTLFHLSLCHAKKNKNTHTIYQRQESDHGVKENEFMK